MSVSRPAARRAELGERVDEGYEAYCLADPVFYESPLVARGDDVDFDVAREPVPEGWERTEFDDWLVYWPVGASVPPQGWKVHASASLAAAEEVLTTVWDYCIANRIHFKFVRSRQLLLLRNGKQASREGSGKFITIYPADEEELERVLTDLGGALDGRPGPYILSDLRWGAGPLFVRYGGFAERYCIGANGEMVLAIADSDGQLVPDRRGATFQVPPWVTLPSFLEPHLAARNGATVEELPYRFESALHFSNGGGVYAGRDVRTQEPVVIKEARPWAGLSADGLDAVARLRREREILGRLDGLGVAPAARDHFTVGEHEFLVLERVEAATLTSEVVARYPLVVRDPDPAVTAEYAEWALRTCARLERAVAQIHERGVVLGDLHPSNVLVRPDGEVVLIDWEVASHVDEGFRPALGDPGFMAPRARTGVDIDRHALACIRLYLFLPLTALFAIAPEKAEELAAEIAQSFPVPSEFLAGAVEVITGPPGTGATGGRNGRPRLVADPAGWREARDSMARAILASATPGREDRLFPGDVKQFTTGGLNLAHGAAGVLYALAATGAGRHPEHEEWLVERALHPQPGVRLGFYDGLHGVAYALDHLGRREAALDLLEICNRELAGKWDRLGLDLRGGLAGIGLNLLHFAAATGETVLWDRASEVAGVVADRLGPEDGVPTVSGRQHPYAGLVRGSSGPALLFIRLYEHTGDGSFLDLAATAIRQDLRRCVLREEGSLEVDEGWRTMPYLADGSVGIGFVLDDFLSHREDDRFRWASSHLPAAAESQFYIEPGLFYGRAGMILYLSRRRALAGAAHDAVIAGHVRRLGWHALTYRGELAFPGEQLMRLSMDLATGTAGVLLALGAALHDEPVHLPFLPSLQVSRVAVDGDLQPTSERR